MWQSVMRTFIGSSTVIDCTTDNVHISSPLTVPLTGPTTIGVPENATMQSVSIAVPGTYTTSKLDTLNSAIKPVLKSVGLVPHCGGVQETLTLFIYPNLTMRSVGACSVCKLTHLSY